ncbi:MAG: protein kinase domain-containing protein [Vicinamibacteria bacterium]
MDPGRVLNGRFRIERQIGQGGMGEVYAAEDLQLGETVALKLLNPGLARDASAVRRFKIETQLARRVTHPNVCRIFDFAVDSGSAEIAFLTMELVEGETLAERLRRDGALEEPLALRVLEQVAAGLRAAHDAGVIHRDLKPSNILLVGDGLSIRVVITDFGLAMSRHQAGAEPNVLAGTPLYMAPEQISGEPVSPATDVFALGLVAYEMLTGEPAAGASSLTRLLEAAEAGLSRRTLELGAIPSRWARVILKCSEPDLSDRYQNAGDVIAALERPIKIRRRAMGGVLLAAMGAALFALLPPAPPRGARSDIPEADAAWQKGRLHARRLLPEDLRRAIDYFQEAVQRDPGFAAAYAGLADAYSTLGDYGGMAPREAFDRARAAAEEAVRLGPNLAEAHASLGLALSLDPRHWKRAEASFHRAIQLDPSYGQAHQWYGAHLARLGNTREAIKEIRIALRSDPVSLPISVVLGWMYYFDGQFQLAIEQAKKTVELDRSFLYGYVLLARTYTETGDFELALQACDRADSVERLGAPPGESAAVVAAARASVQAARGNFDEARRLANELERRSLAEHIPVHYIASIYSLMGDTDRAISALERGLDRVDPGVLYLQVYPPLRGIRDDSRYASLLRRLGVQTVTRRDPS